jgi:hypothetical protein
MAGVFAPRSVSVAAGSVSVPEAVADGLRIVVPDVDPLKFVTPLTVTLLYVGDGYCWATAVEVKINNPIRIRKRFIGLIPN